MKINKNVKKNYFFSIIILAGLVLVSKLASAHAVVKPNQAGVGSFQAFTLAVPSEKALATSGVRLALPAGLNYLTPNVKLGWHIEVKKDGEVAKEINWTGGSIPAGQRDEFVFSAQVPGKQTSLVWKVYQTYSDGSTISWDKDPNEEQPKDASGKPDFSTVGPYSVTKVEDDLTAPVKEAQPSRSEYVAQIISLLALIFSVMAFYHSRKK